MTVRRFQWEKEGVGTGILRRIQIESDTSQHEIQGCLLKSEKPGVGALGLAAFAHRDDGAPLVEVSLGLADIRKLARSLEQFADILEAYERWGKI